MHQFMGWIQEMSRAWDTVPDPGSLTVTSISGNPGNKNRHKVSGYGGAGLSAEIGFSE